MKVANTSDTHKQNSNGSGNEGERTVDQSSAQKDNEVDVCPYLAEAPDSKTRKRHVPSFRCLSPSIYASVVKPSSVE